jgi:hypothetical protein
MISRFSIFFFSFIFGFVFFSTSGLSPERCLAPNLFPVHLIACLATKPCSSMNFHDHTMCLFETPFSKPSSSLPKGIAGGPPLSVAQTVALLSSSKCWLAFKQVPTWQDANHM